MTTYFYNWITQLLTEGLGVHALVNLFASLQHRVDGLIDMLSHSNIVAYDANFIGTGTYLHLNA